MEKIPTIYLRDFDGNPQYVTEEPNPACDWVFAGDGEPTRKYDGTCVMLDEDGQWWARREVKVGKAAPANFVQISVDETTGKGMGWEPIEQSAFAKFHAEALGNPYERRHVGTYELIGPKVNGNPEGVSGHELVYHGDAETLDVPRDFDGLAKWLPVHPEYEGIVFHHPDGRMAKIKRRDFPKA